MTVSAAPVREFLCVTKESALGVIMTSPVAGTDSIYIRLHEGNAFSMRPKPIIEKIPYGGGFAVTSQNVSDHYAVTGNLKTKLHPSQAQLLLDWALTRVTAVPTPWVTTEPIGDLASCTVYHAYRQSDGSFLRKAYTGVKVASLGVDVSRDSTTATLTLGLQAAKAVGFGTNSGNPDATAFPAPTEASYPTDAPYTFGGTAGLLSIATTRTQYRDLSLKVQNKLDGEWFENAFLSILACYGRDFSVDTTLYIKPSPDDRSAYEALTAKTISIGMAGGGTTLTLSMNGTNIYDGYELDLPLDKAYMAKLTIGNVWDPAGASGAGQDLSFAIA